MSEKKSSSGRKINGQFESGNKTALKYKSCYGKQMLEYFENSDKFPLFEVFAAKIGVTSRTLRGWCEKHSRFSAYYERAKEIQYARLLQGGLVGEYNSKFAQFVAENCFDMSHKTSSDTKLSFDITLSGEIDEESD